MYLAGLTDQLAILPCPEPDAAGVHRSTPVMARLNPSHIAMQGKVGIKNHWFKLLWCCPALSHLPVLSLCVPAAAAGPAV